MEDGRELPPCKIREVGEGFAAVDWGPISIVGVYILPKRKRGDRAFYQGVLDGIGACVRNCWPRLVIVAGDFNAHSTLWGCSPRQDDARGATLCDWAVAMDLVLIKGTGSTPGTCVRWQGESVIDLTWASPSIAPKIVDWAVDTEAETLSDHRYVGWGLAPTAQQVPQSHRGGNNTPPRRWALNKLDSDRFMATVLANTWQLQPGVRDRSVGEEADALTGIVVRACDAAMPRSRPRPLRAMYWWTEEIAELRHSSVQARRNLVKARSSDSGVAEARGAYREAREALKVAIGAAKGRAHEEFMASLEGDPWGRPYKMVVGKMRSWAPPATESLDPQVLEGVLDHLFPKLGEGGQPPVVDVRDEDVQWTEDLGVTEAEMVRAGKRLGAKNKAPGPDGIPGRAWALALGCRDLSESMRHLLCRCLEEGSFPPAWRRAKLVLLQKEGKPPGCPSAYRPICLLDEAGKLFERIIADRLVEHLSREGPDLHGQQYGFRRERSTVDAVLSVRALSRKAVEEQGGMALTVSLDIANAFNSLPWTQVGEALRYHRVPPYLQRIIREYFRDRDFAYTTKGEVPRRRTMYCGVPQGSVLGPLLWNIAYDRVLRTALPPGCSVVCYADDTLVLAGGKSWGETKAIAEVAVACVVSAIQGLGLRVAAEKTEALFFHNGRRGPPPETRILVGRVRVLVGTHINYLGLQLDGRWGFGPHFARLALRVGRFGNALSGLMVNFGGPSWRVRRPFLGVVASVALYGAPVWADALATSGRSKRFMNRAMRSVVARAARCYRTVSFTAAAILAGLPPIEFLASQYVEVYRRTRGLRGRVLSSQPGSGGP